MTSLRLQLLAWLIPPYVLVAAVWMGVSYRQYETNIGAFMDGQMHALANTYTHPLAADARQSAVRPLDEQHVQHDGTRSSSSGEMTADSWSAPGRYLH